MTDTQLNPGEKSALTELARKLVDRGARALATPKAAMVPTLVSDAFSEEGRLQRLLEFEQRLDSVSREWSTALNTVMFAVERIETRLVRLEGEVQGLYESNDRLQERLQEKERHLATAANAFGEATATQLQDVLDRVEALLAARLP